MALLAFDWNGTLFDDTAGWAKAYNAALNVLGFAEQPLAQLQHHYDTPVNKSILNFGVTQDLYDQHATSLYGAFATTLAVHTAAALLRENAHDVLTSLKDDGHSIILLSNHHQDMLHGEMIRCGLGDIFANVSGRDCHEQIRTKSTKQDRLRAFMADSGHQTHETFIIGDAREEARIGRELNITSICITGGYSSEEQLRADGAHYIIHDLGEIPAIVSGCHPSR